MVTQKDLDQFVDLADELSQNSFQMGGTAKLIARARGAPEGTFTRADYDLAIAMWWTAFREGRERDLPPKRPKPREMTEDEKLFVRYFRGEPISESRRLD